MPRPVNFGGSSIQFGMVQEFKKLLTKHAVIGADTADLSDAIAKMEHLPGGIENLDHWVRPVTAFNSAWKKFRLAYGKKHPKFIASFEGDFAEKVETVDQLLAHAGSQLAKTDEMLKSAHDFFEKAIDELTKGAVNVTSLKATLDFLTPGMSCYSNAQQSVSELARLKLPTFEKLVTPMESVRPIFVNADKVLVVAIKQNQPNVDVVALTKGFHKVAGACEIFLKQLKAA